MQYLAINQPTANWLLANHELLKELSTDLEQLFFLPQLRIGVVSDGPLRIAATRHHEVVGIWNTEYLGANGLENWAFIRLDSKCGLFSESGIIREVFERSLLIANQRLQGLLLDSKLHHQSHSDGVHSCVAGRGAAADCFVSYAETSRSGGGTSARAILIVGPSAKMPVVISQVSSDKSHLDGFIELANEILVAAIRRPRIDSPFLSELSHRLEKAVFSGKLGGDFSTSDSALDGQVPAEHARTTSHLTYDDWVKNPSPLTAKQRRILDSDVILSQPVRILGAAGSGKTLVMQLLAMRRLKTAEQSGKPVSILYLTHNSAMQHSVEERFVTLGGAAYLQTDNNPSLRIETLMELCLQELEVEATAIIDRDARTTKLFQIQTLVSCIQEVFDSRWHELDTCELLRQITENSDLRDVFAQMMSYEIGVAIKGRGLTNDRKLYSESEQPLSRLHGVLSVRERDIVFDIFERYQEKLFSEYEVLDADDLALTALSRLRTPLWEMKRKREGYDFIFVDETQLFNENERRLFALLRKGYTSYVPIVLALDEAQELRGASSSGFGLLGIEAIFDEELTTVHRCSKQILSLAFSIIQQTTDLFGANFPDFTADTVSVIPEDHKFVKAPKLVTAPVGVSIESHIMKLIRSMRRDRLRSIGIVIHTDRYWDPIVDTLQNSSTSVRVLTVRGETLSADDPVVTVSSPDFVGGQEFDGVIAVGLEQGLVPPRVTGHIAMAAAVEQQALREMYLSFTRAKYQLVIANSHRSAPSSLLRNAINGGLLETES